ncbi:MAG: hypothetical protein ABIV63_09585 [Caldimonas sp.]
MNAFASTLLRHGLVSGLRQEGASRNRPPRAPTIASDDGLNGPGWFDSSWDLQHGLEVSERMPEDASLNEWIEGCLRAA